MSTRPAPASAVGPTAFPGPVRAREPDAAVLAGAAAVGGVVPAFLTTGAPVVEVDGVDVDVDVEVGAAGAA